MISKVIQTIEEEHLLCGVNSVCAAVSGGADSVCMLELLCELRETYGFTLEVLHINHLLRGEQAMRDEAFVVSLCEEKGLPCKVLRIDAAARAEQQHIGVEEAGRLIRYEAFLSSSCDAVAVAHTLSDRTETALFRLARGTAVHGAAGILPRRDKVIRPLLRVTREEVEQYLTARGILWMHDSTNDLDDYSRNFVRHHLVPAFRTLNPAFEQTFSGFMDAAREQTDFLRQEAQRLLLTAKRENGYDKAALLMAHPALRREALRMILAQKIEKDLTRRHLLLCETALSEGGTVQLTKDWFFTAAGDEARLFTRQTAFPLWEAAFSGLCAETVRGKVILKKVTDGTGCLSYEKLSALPALCARSRRAGDRFASASRGVTKTLKKLFNEAKIPPLQRNRVCVLASDDAVVWVEGFGADAHFAGTDLCVELVPQTDETSE